MQQDADLTRLNEAELIAAYIENVRIYDTIDHIGRQNRLMGQRFQIVDELSRRSGGTLESLRQLLDHPDPKIQFATAMHLRVVSDRKPQEKLPRKRGPYAWMVDWQSNNPPPEPMPPAEIHGRLRAAFPASTAERLWGFARAAIGLWPQRPAADMPTTASRWGGSPHAPPGWRWPTYQTEPMFFLGQINCGELRGLPSAEKLPDSGLLAFFGDHDAVMGCGTNDAAVYHWTDLNLLRPVKPPIPVGRVFPRCALAVRPLIDLPDPWSRAVEGVLSERADRHAYFDICHAVTGHGIPEKLHGYCGFSKLLGWPHLVESDLDYLGDPADADAYRLLLQIDHYSNGTEAESWGPGGSLYFLIRDDDLRARRFDCCEFEMQCT